MEGPPQEAQAKQYSDTILDFKSWLRSAIYTHFVRVGFWQIESFTDCAFEPQDFFAGFVARIFLLILWGKSAQKNPPRNSPAKSSKTHTTKSPAHFCRGAGPKFAANIVVAAEFLCNLTTHLRRVARPKPLVFKCLFSAHPLTIGPIIITLHHVWVIRLVPWPPSSRKWWRTAHIVGANVWTGAVRIFPQKGTEIRRK